MADHAAPGVLVGERYRLIDQLGSGGMAVVWRGYDTVLGRKVAVKILNDDLAADPMIAARLRKEAWAVAQLAHANIAHVYDYGSDQPDQGTRAFVVMELVEGQSLRTMIADGGSLPWQQATAIVGQVASALTAAHQRGIVHRDVTPSNIIVCRDGAKVLDFGIAALLGERDSPVDSGDELLGTPAYVAPERLIDPGSAVGPAVDVYALGMVWYRLLTGRLPWSTTSSHDMLMAHIHLAPPPPSAAVGLPAELADLLIRCLAKEAAHRPTGAEVLAAVSSHGLTAPAPPDLWAARPQAPEDLTENITEALVAVTKIQPDRGHQPPHRTAPVGRRSRLALIAAMVCGGLAVAIAVPLFWGEPGVTEAAAEPAVVGVPVPPVTATPATPATREPVPPPGPVTASESADVTVDAPIQTVAAIVSPTTPRGTAVSGLGGTAWISCPDRATAVIESTAPNSGYSLTEARFGPAKDVKAVFVAGPRKTEIKGKCDNGVLVSEVVDR